METPAKKPPMPTSTNGARARDGAAGTIESRNWPQAPPSMPPIRIDGPKTPPLPPELIVSPVATIFRIARVRSSRIPMWGTNGVSPGMHQFRRHADRAPLHPAVAAGHHLRERQRQQAQQQTPRPPA